MKIAFLNLYSGKQVRGAEAFSHALARWLKTNHEIVFIKGNSDLMPSHGFSGSLLNQIVKRAFLDAPAREVLKFTLTHLGKIIRSNFDVVIPLNGFWQVLFLKLFQPIGGYKILVTGHSGPGWDERWNLYLKPNLFIATTGPALEWAKNSTPWTRIKLIPYGVDTKLFSLAQAARLELPRPIILCPAALVPYKRLDLAVKAVSKLRNASLLVLGKGELEDEIRKLGGKLLGSRFYLTHVPHSQIPSYYQASEIVTLPSSPQENSPMVFLESLASGKLVVSSDTPRNRWLLEEAGEYCDPTDLEEYSRSLKKALARVDSQQTAQDIDKALAKFSWKQVLPAYEESLSSL